MRKEDRKRKAKKARDKLEEEVYIHIYKTAGEARESLDRYLKFYNARTASSISWV